MRTRGVALALAAAVMSSLLSSAPARSAVPTDWLGLVNFYRSLASLAPLTEDPALSADDVKHANYMVENNVIQHSEDPANPFFTAGGDAAARNSNLFLGTGSTCYPDATAVNGWMTGPFHAMGILRTTLARTGFGTATKSVGSSCRKAAALDVSRGTGSAPAPSFPYEWPGNGTSVPLLRDPAGEVPDNLSACPGFTYPAGLPVYAFFAGTTNVTAHSFSSAGTALDHCVYDASTYTNPDAASQTVGRQILAAARAVVLIPKAPLGDNSSYTASITSGGTTATWTFNTSTSGAGGGPSGIVRGTVAKGGSPLAGAKACAAGLCQKTGADGAYSLTVPAGAVSVTVKRKHTRCSAGGQRPPVTVQVAAGQTVTLDWTCSKRR